MARDTTSVAGAAPAVNASSRASPLRWMTAGSPTNYNMLLFRTVNREMGQPNANADNLAPLLRDKLMPLRMWWLKHMPGAMRTFKQGLEHKKHGVPGVLNFVDARTSWFDRVVTDALEQHGITQVVVVAAGFDTRAYRLGAKHPDVKFIEIDLPHASKKKQQLVDQLLQPESSYPRPTFLPADLATTPLDSVLLASSPPPPPAATTSHGSTASTGFDPSKPTLFTVEGLIYYLPVEAVRQLFAAMLRVAAPGSRVAFDFLHKQVLDGAVPLPPAYKVTAASVANKGEPFVSGIDDNEAAVEAFLAGIPAPAAALSTQHTAIAPTASTDEIATAAADGSCTEDRAVAASGAAGGSSSTSSISRRFRVCTFLGPREMVAEQLPHLAWNDQVPPILSFYSFAVVVTE